jgi:hypothetical protein
VELVLAMEAVSVLEALGSNVTVVPLERSYPPYP